MGKKKFIDKKKAHHFYLVHRSQRDPLIADENSSPLVLVPSKQANSFRLRNDQHMDYGDRHKFDEVEDENDSEEDDNGEFNDDNDDDNDDDYQDEDSGDENEKEKGKKTQEEKPKQKQKEKETDDQDEIDSIETNIEKVKKPSHENFGEAAKYGIYLDDTEYDYTKHLKEMGAPGSVFIPAASLTKPEKTKGKELVFKNELKLPDEVLPSKYEEEVGLPNRGLVLKGPQPQLGEDVIEALEALDDDGYIDELQDDFMDQANIEGQEIEEEQDYTDQDYDSDDLNGSFQNERFETKSRMTNFSMTSSVLSRTKELQMLDDRFDRLIEQYDDDQIGELRKDEVNGLQSIENFESVLDEFLEEETDKVPIAVAIQKDATTDKKTIVEKFSMVTLSTDDEEEKDVVEVQVKQEEKWDCESVLSTYTNTENRPVLIKEAPKNKIKLGKSGIPVGVLTNRKEKRKEEEEEEEIDDQSNTSDEENENLGEKRSKDETPEEKKERKRLAKEQRKVRRVQKKSTKIAFKTEKIKQEKEITANSRKGIVAL